MKSKFYSKNIQICLLLILVLTGCKKEQKSTFYDKVFYYHTDFYRIPTPPDGTKEFDIYYYDLVDENNKSKYENLSQFGFKEYPINNEFLLKIDDFFTSQNPGPYISDYKCLSCFQDILVFYKKEKIVGTAKFDFKCNRYYFTNFLVNKSLYIKKECFKFQYLFKNSQ
jgi:hypothetical protein